MPYSAIQDGSLSGLSNHHVVGGRVVLHNRVANITGSGDAGAWRGKGGRKSYAFSMDSVWQDGTDYPCPIGGSVANSMFDKIMQATLTKRVNLSDVSNAATPQLQREYQAGNIQYSGTFLAAQQDSESPLETGTTTMTGLSLPLDPTRAIAGNALIEVMQDNLGFTQGGAVIVQCKFSYQAAITLTGSTHPLASSNFTATIQRDNGTTMAGSVLLQAMTAAIDYVAGTPPMWRSQGVFDGPVTIT